MKIKEIRQGRTYPFSLSDNLQGVTVMAEAATKLPVKTEAGPATQPAKAADWQPFDLLRNQVDRLFHDFQTGFLQAPFFRPLPDIESFWRRDLGFNVTPAMDIVEKDKAFEVTAELPGLDAKDIDVQLANGMLTIKGEKQEEKEEKTKGRYVSRAALRFFPPHAAGARQRRRREDRSELQERRPDRHPAEVSGSAEEREDDSGSREIAGLPAPPHRDIPIGGAARIFTRTA